MIATALVAIAVLGSAPDAIDCKNPETQLAMNQCADLKAAKANARLNDVYSRYRKRLDPTQKKKLTEAQRRWLAFRRSWCEFVASGVEEGSAFPFVVLGCITEMTQHRIKELERISSCTEGDLACPSP
jgi:uncharacterized protein YecT (DUF1311 family)